MAIPYAPVPNFNIQQPDLMENLGKIVAMRTMLAQQQEIPIQLQQMRSQAQASQQENQLRQIQVQDAQAGMRAMQQWDGQDMDQLPMLIEKNGGSLQSVLGARNNILKYQTDLANKSKTDLANEQVKNDHIVQAIDNVKSLPPDQQGAAFDEQKAALVQLGYMTPQESQNLQYQGPAQLDQLEKLATGHANTLKNALTVAQTVEATSRAAEAGASVAKLNPDQIGQINGLTKQWYNTINPGKAVPSAFTLGSGATQQDFDRVQKLAAMTGQAQMTEAQRAATNEYRNAMLQMRGMQYGVWPGGSPPPQVEQLADEIGQGKIAPDQIHYLLSRNQGLVALVAQKYPDFDSSKAASYVKAYNFFTSGQAGQQLTKGGTALEHLSELRELVDQNPEAVKVHGTDANVRFNRLATTVAGELSSFYGLDTQAERTKVENQLHGQYGGLVGRGAAIDETAQAMTDRLGNMYQQWTDAAPSSIYEAKMPTHFSSKAKEALQNFAPDFVRDNPVFAPQGHVAPSANLIYATDPNGVLHSAPTGTTLPNGWRAAKAPGQ